MTAAMPGVNGYGRGDYYSDRPGGFQGQYDPRGDPYAQTPYGDDRRKDPYGGGYHNEQYQRGGQENPYSSGKLDSQRTPPEPTYSSRLPSDPYSDPYRGGGGAGGSRDQQQSPRSTNDPYQRDPSYNDPHAYRPPSDSHYRPPGDPYRPPSNQTQQRPPSDPNAYRAPNDPNAYRPPNDPNAYRPPSDPNAYRPPSDPNAYRHPNDPNHYRPSPDHNRPPDDYRGHGSDPNTRGSDRYDPRYPHGVPNGSGPPPDQQQYKGYPAEHAGRPPPEKVDYPSYELDHLATFTVGARHPGMMKPDDGVQKLRQMEISTGVWTMRVQLVVEPRHIVIIDQQTEEEMERFPMNLVSQPTAMTNNNRRDVYNNIVLFTVMEDPYRDGSTEMHLFQCKSKPAQAVVDDIRAAQGGKPRTSPPPSSSVDRRDAPPRHSGNYEAAAAHSARAVGQYNAQQQYDPVPNPRDELEKSSSRPPDEASSTTSEKADVDVKLLNHCFDDVEKFIGMLQHAAESFRQLDSQKKASRQARHGEGMLTMRSRPPPAKHFIDIFQKFKLAFNLLAKLKAQIHDPNSPELVHFLFTPLSLVVEASKDPRQGTPDLASKVVAPLLTPDAKDLLFNCLSSKEAELWHSLGDPWTISSDRWKGYVPPYYPRFSDGWQPDPGCCRDVTNPGPAAETNDPYGTDKPYSQRSSQYDDKASDRGYPQHNTSNPDQYAQKQSSSDGKRVSQSSAQPQESDKNSQSTPPKEPEDRQAAFIKELQAKNAKIYEVIHSRAGKHTKELTVNKGDVLEVLDDTRNWWKLRNCHGDMGHAPYTLLQMYKGGDGRAPRDTPSDVEIAESSPVSPRHQYYQQSQPIYASVITPRYLDESPTHNSPIASPLYVGDQSPSYNSPAASPRYGDQAPSYNPPLVAASPRHGDQAPSYNPAPVAASPRYGDQAPSYNPPLVAANPYDEQPQPYNSAQDEWRGPRSIDNADDIYADLTPIITNEEQQDESPIYERNARIAQSDLHDELLTLMTIGKRTNQKPRSRAPAININQDSSPSEVTDWLASKGFSSNVQQKLRHKSGSEVFRLDKTALERMFSKSDASRLESQLTIQKNRSGFQGTETEELQEILQRRKQKSDDINLSDHN